MAPSETERATGADRTPATMLDEQETVLAEASAGDRLVLNGVLTVRVLDAVPPTEPGLWVEDTSGRRTIQLGVDEALQSVIGIETSIPNFHVTSIEVLGD